MASSKEMLREQFDRIDEALDNAEPGTKEYHELLKDWADLHERLMVEDKTDIELAFKNQEAQKPWYRKLDINTIISAGVSLLGIGLVTKHEELNNITSKAFSWIHKPRLK